jgi:hypothetical protein
MPLQFKKPGLQPVIWHALLTQAVVALGTEVQQVKLAALDPHSILVLGQVRQRCLQRV